MSTTEGAPRRRRRRKAATEPDENADHIVETGGKPAAKSEAKAATKPGTPTSTTVPKGEVPKDIFQGADGQSGFPKAPDMQRGFQTIVKDLFDDGYDVVEEYTACKEAMVIKDALTPERLKRAANEQEDISLRAHRLYIVGKVEVSAYMRETEAVYGAIRDAAIQHLEQQKANKTRTKQITDADVKAEAARLYPDEWADICTRRDRAEAMLSQLQRLSEAGKSRCYTISNMQAPGNRSV